MAGFFNSTNFISKHNLDLELTRTELAFIKYLITSSERLVSRDCLAEALWGEGWEEKYSDWAIDQTAHRLRKKLTRHKVPAQLITRKGMGFALIYNDEISN